ncbi:MAG: 3'-5' exonuclease, partial [Burkholderiaceae bacterium]|nr:3'-5' exonuclease [Burkholderiaceae bacterium]
VSGNLRCVLVDEFQDVNDEIYRVIRGVSAQPNRAAAVMVIGDDDQDILRWNRENGTSSEPYFRSFIRDYSLTDSDIVTLAVNFRSGPQIVERTQKFLNNFFGRHGAKSSRIKTNELRSVDEAEDAAVNAVDLRGDSLDTALDMVREAIDASKTGTHQSVAVLCRTNHEVALAYHHLMRTCPELVVYNNVSYPVSRLRHIGTWLDLLKNDLAAYGDQPLADPIFNRVDAVYQSSDIPEVRAPSNDALVPRQLWDLCKREASYPYLSHLIDFVESLDSDDVIRLIGHQSSVHQPPVVSTIHKIKGLEFDKVFVLPSYASFPFQTTDRAAIFENAAEEARLMYVALTRAKRSVTYYIGDREQAWWNAKSFEGNLGSGKMLVGSPAKEVGISWAWKKISGYNPNPESTLSYIQSTVRVGDKLSVGGYGSSLFHSTGSSSPRQVGYLAEASGGGGSASDLEVSAVLRLPYDEEGKQYYGPVTATAPSVRKQGWGLVVLAAGILRR